MIAILKYYHGNSQQNGLVWFLSGELLKLCFNLAFKLQVDSCLEAYYLIVTSETGYRTEGKVIGRRRTCHLE
jgi:hypothetical protein